MTMNSLKLILRFRNHLNPEKNRSGSTLRRVGLQVLLTLSCTAFPVVAADLEVSLSHPTMDMRVGFPAIIKPGEAYPSLKVVSQFDGKILLSGAVIREDNGAILHRIGPIELQKGGETPIPLEGNPAAGRYRLGLTGLANQAAVFKDAYYFSVLDPEALPAGHSLIAHPGADGQMVYIPDYRGNRIPDFSLVGYRSGAEPIPDVPVKITLSPEPGMDNARIQQAIDQVSAMPASAQGFRGAVLLKQGIYEVDQSLNITTAGVILRGEGPGRERRNPYLDPDSAPSREALIELLSKQEGTFLITAGRVVVAIAGKGGVEMEAEPVGDILETYVPVGATTFTLRDPSDLRAGDTVIVRRHGNEAWIKETGMDRIPGRKITQWTPLDLDFQRTVVAVNKNQITIDSPIVTAIEQQWGGGRVFRYDDPGRVSLVGVENLRMIQYVTPDERSGLGGYRGNAVSFTNAKDSWVRDLVAEHYYEHGITFGNDTRNITVRDTSLLLADDKYFAGYLPRYGFLLEGGATLNLVENCFALNHRHAYILSAWLTGPNVFHNSVSENDVTNSEPHHRWSSGGLYDNMLGRLALLNRLNMGSGHGWAGANYVAWNTRGQLINERPPTAQNWAIGHVGLKLRGPYHDWSPTGSDSYEGGGFGYWELHSNLTPMGVNASNYLFFGAPESTLTDHPYSNWMAGRRNNWIQYDLRKAQTVSGLKLSFPMVSAYVDAKRRGDPLPPQDRLYRYDIAVSIDGKNWQPVVEAKESEAKGHDVFDTVEFPAVTTRYVRVIAQGSRSGGEESDMFHLNRVHILPEPQFDAVDPVPGVIPTSLYLQQLKERYSRK